MKLAIPGRPVHDLAYAVLDVNGTIALDGDLLEGVEERLTRLGGSLRVVIVTADTHRSAADLGRRLGLETTVVGPGDENNQKLEVVRRLDADRVVAIGNGSNDAAMLKHSALGICVVGTEGASVQALLSADVVVSDVRDALDLLLVPQRLIATLRM